MSLASFLFCINVFCGGLLSTATSFAFMQSTCRVGNIETKSPLLLQPRAPGRIICSRSAQSNIQPEKDTIEVNTSNLLQQRIDKIMLQMARFYGQDMVDTSRKRFYYECHPQDGENGERYHVHFPIRDLAAAWDATKLLEWMDLVKHSSAVDFTISFDSENIQTNLMDAVQCTLGHYSKSLTKLDQNIESKASFLNKDIILETPNIGHSALLLLGICSSTRLGLFNPTEYVEQIEGLVYGILSMQLENGAFNIEFGHGQEGINYLKGIEFFPGEALVALMHTYELSLQNTNSQFILQPSTQQAILTAMERAFDFYSNYHHTEDVDTNYNIWQALAFAKFHEVLYNQQSMRKRANKVAQYVLVLCQEICQSRSWKTQLARGQSFYVNLETVEIACGLDALAEGIRVSRNVQMAQLSGEVTEELDEDVAVLCKLFQRHSRNAIDFIEWKQNQVPLICVVGRGGLGFGGIQVLEQRLDVTGHAISALTKLRNLPSL